MATVPVSGTNIRILSGVPFSPDYKHSRWFDSKSEQTTYFQNKNVLYHSDDHTFQRMEGRTFIKVNKSIDDLFNANYVMFQNTKYHTKWFYAFVTKLEYVNKAVTYVHFEMDVLQTWMFEHTFKPSFVIREHCKLWNSDGTPVLNTVDEGLNYGSEYDVVSTVQFQPYGGYKWLVIVAKQTIHKEVNEVSPTIIGTPQPLSYYILPYRDNDMTPTVLIDGKDYPITPPSTLLKEIYQSETAVNNIVSMYVTDYTGIPVTYQRRSEEDSPDILKFTTNKNMIVKNVTFPDTPIQCIYVEKMVDFKLLYQEVFEDKYGGYAKPKESKLLMHPYCTIVMDDFKGNRTQYKPEYVDSKNFYINVKGSLGTTNKVSFNVPDYNHSKEDGQRDLTSNESALINNTPSDVPILSDYLTAYLQGNRNSIENQKNGLIWNGLSNAALSVTGAFAQPTITGVAGNAISGISGAGNTVLQLQGIEAKQQDIQNLPPQLVKMGGNTAYDYGNGYNGVFIMKKQIKPEYRKKLSDFFNQYGYKVNEVKIPNFHTRRYWNYVQTADCNITGDFNHDDLSDLKNVFNNGITLWHTDDIGNYKLENEVL